MTTLGNRIRALRKKRKLTLESLAGNQLTKGMLSLIENDKAKPSMESLEYIARRLEVEVNELLQEISVSELREILNDVNQDFNHKNYKLVYEKLANIIKLELPLCLEAGKINAWYGMSCFHLGMNHWKDYLDKADQICLSLHLYNESTKINSFLMYTKMRDFDYDGALQIVREKRKYFEDNKISLDMMTELDLSYNEVILLFAVGNYKEAANHLTKAISLCKEKNILYRMDHLYRVAYYYAMINGVDKDMNFYLKKLSLLAELLDSAELQWVVLFFRAEYYIEISHQYEKALQCVEQFSEIETMDKTYEIYYYMMKGKVLYGFKQYENALEYLIKIKEFPNDQIHPFDLSIQNVIYAYIARCYIQLGDANRAIHYANIAKQNMENLPVTPYKTFMEETYNLVMNS